MRSTGNWYATVSDIAACAEIVHKGDADKFAAVMAAPAEMRDVLFPLHALTVEVSRAPWVTKEPMIAEMRLQWWRDALGEIAEGNTVRRHEVVTPLAELLRPETAAMLDGMVEVRRWDIYKDPFEDEAHFRDYLTQSSGSVLRAACQTLGESDEACDDFGYASGLASYLKAVPELEEHGRVPLIDGRTEAIKALAQSGLDALQNVRNARPSKRVRQVFLSGWQAEAILKSVVQEPALVARGALGASDAAKKASLIWKAFMGRV